MCTDVFISEFLAFRDQCIWLRCCYNTYRALYESTPETVELLSKVANIFFRDLNRILIEYCWLQICKITDPAQSQGRDNLTVAYINSKIEAMGLITDDIRQYSNSIYEYRNVLKTGRNRLVSHLDKETVLSDKCEGVHSSNDVEIFFLNLQNYVDGVGNVIGVGPLDFSVSIGQGAVIDLILMLRKCTQQITAPDAAKPRR